MKPRQALGEGWVAHVQSAQSGQSPHGNAREQVLVVAVGGRSFGDGPRCASPLRNRVLDFEVQLLQSSSFGKHGVFFSHPLEALSIHTERNPSDPRITHELVLEVDDFGNVKQKASIAYGRSPSAPGVQPEQLRTWATLSESDYVPPSAPTVAWYREGGSRRDAECAAMGDGASSRASRCRVRRHRDLATRSMWAE